MKLTTDKYIQAAESAYQSNSNRTKWAALLALAQECWDAGINLSQFENILDTACDPNPEETAEILYELVDDREQEEEK